MRNSKKIITILVGLFFLSPNVSAQNIPSSVKSGVVEREQKDTRPKVFKTGKDNLVIDKTTKVKKQQPVESTAKIQVKQIVFKGNPSISTKVLKAFAASYENKNLSVSDLNKLCDEIRKYYVSKGYILTYVYLPTQDIVNDVVKLNIIEGEVGNIIVEGNKHYSTSFIKNHFLEVVGKPLNYNELFKRVNILNEYLNLNVRVFMQKGKEVGKTDILLKVTDTKPFSLSASYDNTGSRYVSNDQANVLLAVGNIITSGDKFSVNYTTGFPLDVFRDLYLDFEMPVLYSGTKLKFFYDKSKHKLTKEFKPFDISGKSDTLNLRVSHPLKAVRNFIMDGFFGIESKTTADYYFGEKLYDQQASMLFLGTNMEVYDSLDGHNFLTLKLTQGIDAFGSNVGLEGTSARIDEEESFTNLFANFYRIQNIADSLMFLLKAEGQLTNDRLPVSQQYAIGGMYSVRGYTASRFLGDIGFNSSLELYMPISFLNSVKVPFTDVTFFETLRFKIFVDYGYVKNQDTVNSEYEDEDIYGYGFGFDFNFPDDFNINLSVGFPGKEKDPDLDYSSVVYVRVHKKFM